jgi:hypothetical protein
MKATPLILVASLAGNVALLAVFVQQSGLARSQLEQPAATTAIDSPPRQSESSATTTRIASSSAPGETLPDSIPLWRQVFSDDLRVFAQQLAAAGFPPAVVRGIVEDQLSRRFRDERRKIKSDDSSLPYWQSARNPPFDRELAQRMSALEGERQKLLRETLTPQSILDDEMRLGWMRRHYGVSDPQKLVQLSAILEDYQQVGNEASGNSGSTDPDLVQETQRMIQREQLADIATLLTPEEFAAYELRAGNLAQGLRNSLRDFRPTETEYRALFSAYRAGEDSTGNANFDPARLLERVSNLLAPERYAELRQAVAPGASGLNRIAMRLNIPLPAVAPAYEAQRELRERATAVRNDRTLAPEQRNSQLAAIADEATRRITAVLGERGFAAYREREGNWIGTLTSPTPAPGR